MKPNFKTYTLNELIEVRDAIDQDKYPQRHMEIIEEIKKRKAHQAIGLDSTTPNSNSQTTGLLFKYQGLCVSKNCIVVPSENNLLGYLFVLIAFFLVAYLVAVLFINQHSLLITIGSLIVSLGAGYWTLNFQSMAKVFEYYHQESLIVAVDILGRRTTLELTPEARKLIKVTTQKQRINHQKHIYKHLVIEPIQGEITTLAIFNLRQNSNNLMLPEFLCELISTIDPNNKFQNALVKLLNKNSKYAALVYKDEKQRKKSLLLNSIGKSLFIIVFGPIALFFLVFSIYLYTN